MGRGDDKGAVGMTGREEKTLQLGRGRELERKELMEKRQLMERLRL